MSDSFYYVRLKPYSPRTGHHMTRYHFNGNLFSGGERPVWYKVTKPFAEVCRAQRQESGADAFDIVSATDKAKIDAVEEERRLVALGMMSATIAAPGPKQSIDLSKIKQSGRDEAVPVSIKSGDLSTADLGLGAK